MQQDWQFPEEIKMVPAEPISPRVICMLGKTFIELIQPVRSDNRFARFLEEREEGFFHLCFFTEEFDKETELWKRKGYSVEIETANIFPDHPFRLAWLPPESTSGVWIELSDAAAIPEHICNHKF